MMIENKREGFKEVELFDTVTATVTDSCSSGLFLELENGEDAFAYFGALPSGCKVLCSVTHRATPKKRIRVSIDSVLSERVMAA